MIFGPQISRAGGEQSNNKRFEPLTLQDDFSRYLLLAEAMPENTEGVKKALIRAFKCYGMPKVIHSDNGLSIWGSF